MPLNGGEKKASQLGSWRPKEWHGGIHGFLFCLIHPRLETKMHQQPATPKDLDQKKPQQKGVLSNETIEQGQFFKKILFICFRERWRKGEREIEKHQCVRETLIGSLSHLCNSRHPPHVSWALPLSFYFLFSLMVQSISSINAIIMDTTYRRSPSSLSK